MKEQINIPIELIQYCVKERCTVDLQVFLAAKLVSPGRFTLHDHWYVNLSKVTGKKDQTVRKHLKALMKRNWVGYDARTKSFYLRSWGWLWINEQFNNRLTVIAGPEEIRNFRVFGAAVLICDLLRKQQSSVRRKNWKRNRKNTNWITSNPMDGLVGPVVTNTRNTTSQGPAFHSSGLYAPPPYYGLSNHRISQALCCSYANAVKLKHKAASFGYINLRSKHLEIMKLRSPDYTLRSKIYRGDEDYARKIRFLPKVMNGKKAIVVVRQLHDEIIPKIGIRKIKLVRTHTATVGFHNINRVSRFNRI